MPHFKFNIFVIKWGFCLQICCGYNICISLSLHYITSFFIYIVLCCHPRASNIFVNAWSDSKVRMLYCFLSVAGTGDLKFSNWYFDYEKSQCTAFLYHGSGGNANRFETLEQCERQCGAFKNQVLHDLEWESYLNVLVPPRYLQHCCQFFCHSS